MRRGTGTRRGRTKLRQPQSRLAVSPVGGASGSAIPKPTRLQRPTASKAWEKPIPKKEEAHGSGRKSKAPEVKALKEVDKTRAKIEQMHREREARRRVMCGP